MKTNDGMFIPPIGVCAACHIPLGINADRVTVTFETYHAGRVVGSTFTLHACSTLHASESMRKLARMFEDRVHRGRDGIDLDGVHGAAVVKVGGHD